MDKIGYYSVLLGLIMLVLIPFSTFAITTRRLGMGSVGVALGDDISDFTVNPGADFSDSIIGMTQSWLYLLSSESVLTP